jgi:hypothetical protein
MVAECSVDHSKILIFYVGIRIKNVDVSSLKILIVRNIFTKNLRFYRKRLIHLWLIDS